MVKTSPRSILKKNTTLQAQNTSTYQAETIQGHAKAPGFGLVWLASTAGRLPVLDCQRLSACQGQHGGRKSKWMSWGPAWWDGGLGSQELYGGVFLPTHRIYSSWKRTNQPFLIHCVSFIITYHQYHQQIYLIVWSQCRSTVNTKPPAKGQIL